MYGSTTGSEVVRALASRAVVHMRRGICSMGGSRLRRAIVITTFTQKRMGQLALQRIGKYDTSFNLVPNGTSFSLDLNY